MGVSLKHCRVWLSASVKLLLKVYGTPNRGITNMMPHPRSSSTSPKNIELMNPLEIHRVDVCTSGEVCSVCTKTVTSVMVTVLAE